MSWRILRNFALLTLCLGGSAVAATPSPVADAAERHDSAAVRALLGNPAGVNVPVGKFQYTALAVSSRPYYNR